MNIVKNRDVVIGLLLAIVGLIFLVILIPQGIVEPRKVKYAAMSPSFYPRLVAIALVLLGLALDSVLTSCALNESPHKTTTQIKIMNDAKRTSKCKFL